MSRRGLTRTNVDELDVYRGGFNPIQRSLQQSLASDPRAFDFSELDKRYPTANVRPITPLYRQREIDEYELQRKANEIEVQKRQAELNIYDSRLNQEREMFKQIPMARQALAGLNPNDDDFLEQLMMLQSQFPLAFESSQFRSITEPLVSRHKMLQENKMILERRRQGIKEEEPVSMREFGDAAEKLKNKTLVNAAENGDEMSQFLLDEAQKVVDRAMAQRGFNKGGNVNPSATPSPSPTPFPSSTPQQNFTPIQGTSGQRRSMDDIFR